MLNCDYIQYHGLLKVSACDGVWQRLCFSQERVCGHKHMTSISEVRLLIYIVLFRSHALLTQVTPPAGLSKQLSGLRSVLRYVQLC